MTLTRRSFLAGLGSVSVGLLFRKQLDSVLNSLERDLADEPQTPEQRPSVAEIRVMPQMAFRPERLIVSAAIAHLFVIEDICIGGETQLAEAGAIPAEIFTATSPDAAITMASTGPGTEIRFRVRYIGDDPRGARFQAAMIGRGVDGPARMVLPIDSGCEIVA